MDKSEIQNLIKELIEKTTVPVSSISISEDEASKSQTKTTWFSAEVSQPHFFWGRGGEALFALNHLARRMVETKMGSGENPLELEILIDINGFQKKRIENVRAVAHMMAERARYFKSNIEVDPMPAFERKIVHEFLSDAIDLKTESEGMGPTRRVVIKYVGSI
jgi:spoIIIJ-associated protein